MLGQITIENISKKYRLYPRSRDRITEAVSPFRRKYHEEFKALDNISAVIQPGITTGIIGRNGSGKSTLLKIITGIVTPSAGQVVSQGRIAALLELGAGFNPELSGKENVYFHGTILGYSRREMQERMPAIEDFADIGRYIDQPVKTYSSGMFVRLAFAVSININPDILIVDEALAVGDINFQARCYRRFNEFRDQGRTVLFVSHSMETILRYCDKVILLEEGQKLCDTDPKTAVDAYKQLMAERDQKRVDENRSVTAASKPAASPLSKENFNLNPDSLVYGNGDATISEFGILDEKGTPSQLLTTGETFSIAMQITFHTSLTNPIFAYSIKDLKGVELTGTNTLFQEIVTGTFKAGEQVRVTFKQKLLLQSGNYALSLGCTGMDGDSLLIYQRLYDVLLFEVAASSPLVGLFDSGSQITIA